MFCVNTRSRMANADRCRVKYFFGKECAKFFDTASLRWVVLCHVHKPRLPWLSRASAAPNCFLFQMQRQQQEEQLRSSRPLQLVYATTAIILRRLHADPTLQSIGVLCVGGGGANG